MVGCACLGLFELLVDDGTKQGGENPRLACLLPTSDVGLIDEGGGDIIRLDGRRIAAHEYAAHKRYFLQIRYC